MKCEMVETSNPKLFSKCSFILKASVGTCTPNVNILGDYLHWPLAIVSRKETMKNLLALEWGLISHLGRNIPKLFQADGYHSCVFKNI